MTEGDLEGVAVLFGALKALSTAVTPSEDARLSAMFDSHVRTVISNLKNSLDELTDPFLRQAQILSAKFDLYDVCYQQSIAFAGTMNREFAYVCSRVGWERFPGRAINLCAVCGAPSLALHCPQVRVASYAHSAPVSSRGVSSCSARCQDA